jgi:hypothetical protein
MDTNRKVFRNSSPTPGAELRGVPGWDFDDCSGSLFRFPAQYIKEAEPSRISHRPVECCSTIPSLHLFDADSVIVPDKLIGNFEVEIPSLVRDFLMCFGYQYPGFVPAARALDTPRESLLAHGQYILRLLEESGIANFHTIRGGEKKLQPDIDTNCSVVWGQGFKRDIIAGEADEPLPVRSTVNCYGLYRTFDRAREPKLESTDVPDGKVFAVQLPARLFQGEGVIAISSPESREAHFAVTIVKTAKEALIGSIQALKDILKYLRAYFLILKKGLFQFGKLILLFASSDGMMVRAVSSDSLFQSAVIELATQKEPVLSSVNGVRIGFDTILKRFHPLHDLNLANSTKGVKPYRASPSVSPL